MGAGPGGEGLKIRLSGEPPALGNRGLFLAGAYSTAVAYVGAALASNHFLHIRRLRKKGAVSGYWARVITPTLLSAVLYRKVATLRELALREQR